MKYLLIIFTLSVGMVAGVCIANAAAPCPYDVTPLPVKKGVVSRITASGILLRDGTMVILPRELLVDVRLGQSLTVRGLFSLKGKIFKAIALDAASPVCPDQGSLSIKKGPFAGSADYDQIHN